MSQKKSLSRSELVRRRRQAEPRGPSPFVRKTKAKSRYRELPPITARGVVNDFAIERRKKAGKRRFNAAISLPRPKLRALPLPRIHIRVGWRLLSFTLVLLFGGALYLFWSLPEFRVSAAQVTGNQRIPTDEINNALGLNGYPIFLLPPDQVRARALRSFPELASVKVTISLPNIVTVQVTERQPLIQWQQGSGYTWIDETGAAFRPRGEAQGLIVVQTLGSPPVMSAPEDDPLAAPPFIPQETVQALKALAPHVPPGTPIMYDPLTGLSWTDGRGWQAILGTSAEDMEAKVLVYQAMVDWLTQRGIRPTLINVAYSNAPFYHVEQVEEPAQDQVDAETVSEEQ